MSKGFVLIFQFAGGKVSLLILFLSSLFWIFCTKHLTYLLREKYRVKRSELRCCLHCGNFELGGL